MNDEPLFRITLLRHGESVGNAEERLQGHADFPLSDRGRAQVRSLAQRWRDEGVVFDHVIASPLARALDTARILSATLTCSDFETDPLWIEQDAGRHAGLHWDRIDRSAASAMASSDPEEANEPRAESAAALAERARRALDALVARSPGRYLVVSHRALLNAVLLVILGVPGSADDPRRPAFRIANASFARVRFYPAARRWQIDAIGDRAHWRDGH